MMKERWDQNTGQRQPYVEGYLVLMSTDHLPLTRESKKLNDKWRGPFKIIRRVGEVAYKLDLPPTWKGHPVFNEAHLKVYQTSVFPNQDKLTSCPEPVLLDQSLEYKSGEHPRQADPGQYDLLPSEVEELWT
jgi:hypothetical protein